MKIRVRQPPAVPAIVDGCGHVARCVARHHRTCAGRHDENEMFVVASQRSQICQRPGLLRQSGQNNLKANGLGEQIEVAFFPTTSSVRKSTSSIPSSWA
mgnify:CR=1 FL=1